MEEREVNHEDIACKINMVQFHSGNGEGNQGRKRFSWAGVDMWSENFMLSEKV